MHRTFVATFYIHIYTYEKKKQKPNLKTSSSSTFTFAPTNCGTFMARRLEHALFSIINLKNYIKIV